MFPKGLGTLSSNALTLLTPKKRLPMLILIACESSGIVRDAFRKRGHEAYSCDLLPADTSPEHHLQKDALDAIHDAPWQLVIAHPPCTYLCSSGLHWNTRVEGRSEKTEQAAEFFMAFTRLKCQWAIENPIGCMSRRYRKPDQIIQPHQFGHDASKATCLWLHELPQLTPTEHIQPRIFQGKRRWSNQTDSGQNRLPPSADRWKLRSKTYQGIADAMADQWTRKSNQ